MRISDWSSDVCSSDLTAIIRAIPASLSRNLAATLHICCPLNHFLGLFPRFDFVFAVFQDGLAGVETRRNQDVRVEETDQNREHLLHFFFFEAFTRVSRENF